MRIKYIKKLVFLGENKAITSRIKSAEISDDQKLKRPKNTGFK
jgi:hypothetical protein